MTDRRCSRRGFARVGLPAFLTALSAAAAAAVFIAPQDKNPVIGKQADGTYLVSTNQAVSPIGTVQQIEGARPKDAALSPDGKTLAVLTQSRVVFFSAETTALRGTVPLAAGPLGIAWLPGGSAVYATMAGGRVARLVPDGDGWKKDAEFRVDVPAPTGAGTGDLSTGQAAPKGDPQTAGLAVSPDGQRLYVALGIRNAVAVLALPEGKVIASVPVGIAPYRVRLSPDGKTLFVANRGGRAARAGEPSALSAGTPVRIDPRTDAALRGSISFVDTEQNTATHIEAGRQPSGLAISADGGTLYVANSDDDTVSVVDVRARRVAQSVSLRPGDDPGFGQIPTDVVLSADNKTLYVACGGGNSVAVVALLRPAPRVQGYLPTGWFPIALAERAGQLFVASSKGFGSRVVRANGGINVHGTVGTVQFISPETGRDIARHTRQVGMNNRWSKSEPPARKGVASVPIPERVGEPSLFKHVVFIIKENQTYDSLLGDMPEGNGDKSLCLFPEEITPNHHALAREWVLLDNTYTSGTNSADGHQWTVSAAANGYIEQNYSANARSYPYDGGDPLAYSPEGFLWTSALKAGRSVRVYGEFVNKPKVVDRITGKRPTWTQLWQDYKAGGDKYEITADTDNAALKPHLHPRYIGFPSIVSDQWRADQYLQELAQFDAAGKMPDLSILLLPNDHTIGTRPGTPTPRATVADNDLALGRIVEGLTKSRFWKDMLILVIEDDSQLGLDHVDGHRTTAFCISPYTRRGAVVSDPYNHTSFARTMGLALGFPAMNRFDRTATPMTACFTDKPDLRPYAHRPNRIPLDEMNPPAAALRGEARRLAEASERLDWSDVDRADAATVAQAVWRSLRPGKPFPWAMFRANRDD